jgi:general stress protein YciG
VPAGERSFSQNRELAAAAGRKGGESRAMLFNPQHERGRRPKEQDDKEKQEQDQEERQEEATEETA